MTIRDVIGIQATGNNTAIQLFIEYRSAQWHHQ